MGAHPGADRGEVAELLNSLALEASTGSYRSLDLLLQVIEDQRLAVGTVRRFLLNDELVEEATQDTMIAVAESIHKFRGDSKFTTWLYAVARNVAIGHLRRVNPSVPLDDNAENAAGRGRRLSSVVAERAAIQRAVEQLPDHYRDTVMLRDIEQRSYEEIADELGIELNTVRSRLARGRAMLAAAILDEGHYG